MAKGAVVTFLSGRVMMAGHLTIKISLNATVWGESQSEHFNKEVSPSAVPLF